MGPLVGPQNMLHVWVNAYHAHRIRRKTLLVATRNNESGSIGYIVTLDNETKNYILTYFLNHFENSIAYEYVQVSRGSAGGESRGEAIY